jgi:transposase
MVNATGEKLLGRHELTDDQWGIIQELLAVNPDRRGRPSKKGDRQFINAVLYIQAVGCAWRDLPTQYGPWKSVFNRFSRWSENGFWQALFDSTRDALVSESVGSLVDGSIVRAHQDSCGGRGGPSENLIGRSRGGPSTKIHAVTTLCGLPLHVELSAGQEHDVKNAVNLIPHIKGNAFIADKGYDSNSLIASIEAAGKEAIIGSSKARKEARKIDDALYGHRYKVEIFFHDIKRKRRIATRYEKTARNYKAFVHLACGMLWLAAGFLA